MSGTVIAAKPQAATKFRLTSDLIFSIADQAALSLANLAVGYLVLRHASKDAYGLYGVAISLILLLIGVISAVFAAQITVQIFHKTPERRKAYAGAMMTGQLGLSIASAIVIIAALVGAAEVQLFSFDVAATLSIAVAVGLIVAAQDLFRSYFYLEAPRRACLSSLITSVIWGFGTFLLLKIWPQRPERAALLAYGIAGLIGVMIGFVGTKLKLVFNQQLIKQSTREAWPQGRWSLGIVIVSFASSNGYVFLLGAIVGLASVAEANAARLLLAPCGLIITGFAKSLTPRFARMYAAKDFAMMKRYGRVAMLVLATLVTLYVIIAGMISARAAEWLLPAGYRNLTGAIIAWGAAFFFQALRNNSSMLLQVVKQYHYVLIAACIGAAIVILASLPLIAKLGVLGGVIAVACGEAIQFALLWQRRRKLALK